MCTNVGINTRTGSRAIRPAVLHTPYIQTATALQANEHIPLLAHLRAHAHTHAHTHAHIYARTCPRRLRIHGPRWWRVRQAGRLLAPPRPLARVQPILSRSAGTVLCVSFSLYALSNLNIRNHSVLDISCVPCLNLNSSGCAMWFEVMLTMRCNGSRVVSTLF